MKRAQIKRLKRGIAMLAIGGVTFSHTDISHADIYKWVDANGRVHFGDAPPRDQRIVVDTLVKEEKDSRTKVIVPPPSNAAQRLADQLREERIKREEKVAREAQRRQKRQQGCEYAKNRIEHMRSIHVFYDVNPDGTVRYLSDKEGDQLRKQTEGLYQKHCSEQTSFVSTSG